jgi:hypothetical protein
MKFQVEWGSVPCDEDLKDIPEHPELLAVTGAAGCDEIVAQVGEYPEGIGFPREADDGWA